MNHLRVLLGFTSASNASVLERAQAVHDHLYISPLWTVPPNPPIPVTAIVLDTAMNVFSIAMAAADLGGPADTADRNIKRPCCVSSPVMCRPTTTMIWPSCWPAALKR